MAQVDTVLALIMEEHDEVERAHHLSSLDYRQRSRHNQLFQPPKPGDTNFYVDPSGAVYTLWYGGHSTFRGWVGTGWLEENGWLHASNEHSADYATPAVDVFGKMTNAQARALETKFGGKVRERPRDRGASDAEETAKAKHVERTRRRIEREMRAASKEVATSDAVAISAEA